MSHLFRDTHQGLAEIAALQHVYKGGWRLLKAVGYVLAIADAPISDGGSDSAQEVRIVLGGEFVVDVAAQGETFAQHLAHGCGKKIWSGSGSGRVILGNESAHRHARKLVE